MVDDIMLFIFGCSSNLTIVSHKLYSYSYITACEQCFNTVIDQQCLKYSYAQDRRIIGVRLSYINCLIHQSDTRRMGI